MQVKQARFVSLRWRIVLPLFVAVLIIAMVGAYFLANSLSGDFAVSQTNILMESSRAVSQRIAALYERQRVEAQGVAFTIGVPEAIASGQASVLYPAMEAIASRAGLDSIIVTDARGIEIVGIQRVVAPDVTDYAVSTETNLSNEIIVQSVLEDGYIGATGLMRTTEGVLLYTAVPVNPDNELVGVAMVGQQIDRIIAEVHGSAIADVALYGPDGALMQTTFDPNDKTFSALALDDALFDQAARAVQNIPAQSLTIGSTLYQGAYFPFAFGPNILGVIGVVMPDNIPFATEMGRQLTSLMLATLAAVVVVGLFIGVNILIIRMNRVTQAAEALASGDITARTGMKATDEIGAMGRALDQYADYVQERQDILRGDLRRQRRETTHLLAVLESLPDGIVVQDSNGRVILMNDKAKTLLGSQQISHSPDLHELIARVTDVLGPALAPGLYSLGSPQHIDMDGKMLSAQAAAVMTLTGQRVGTVVVIRDITADVRRERARDKILTQIAQEVQVPLAALSNPAQRSPMSEFAREITRHAVALQKMVVEMRELADTNLRDIPEQRQRPIPLDTLVWSVANEWRQIAQANNLTLHVIIEKAGLHVLGNERRLRWAIGNIIDNAIKYTTPGGALTLEIRDDISEGRAHLRVRDNGVGIKPDELPNVLTRFYRGNPTTKEGRAIRVPGTGQGLTSAKQIFEAHGGGLTIKSKLWVGTAVYFTIPLTAPVGLEIPGLAADLEGETVRIETIKINRLK
jgi:two-component system, OmpR family, sensor histidine kinase ResE